MGTGVFHRLKLVAIGFLFVLGGVFVVMRGAREEGAAPAMAADGSRAESDSGALSEAGEAPVHADEALVHILRWNTQTPVHDVRCHWVERNPEGNGVLRKVFEIPRGEVRETTLRRIREASLWEVFFVANGYAPRVLDEEMIRKGRVFLQRVATLRLHVETVRRMFPNARITVEGDGPLEDIARSDMIKRFALPIRWLRALHETARVTELSSNEPWTFTVPPGWSMYAEVQVGKRRVMRMTIPALEPGEIRDVRLAPPGLGLRGRVIDIHGVPVPNASVSVVVSTRVGKVKSEREVAQTCTNEQGEFLIMGPLQGATTLRCRGRDADGVECIVATPIELDDDRVTDMGDIQLVATGPVTSIDVRWEDGLPLESPFIMLNETSRRSNTAIYRCDERGRVVFADRMFAEGAWTATVMPSARPLPEGRPEVYRMPEDVPIVIGEDNHLVVATVDARIVRWELANVAALGVDEFEFFLPSTKQLGGFAGTATSTGPDPLSLGGCLADDIGDFPVVLEVHAGASTWEVQGCLSPDGERFVFDLRHARHVTTTRIEGTLRLDGALCSEGGTLTLVVVREPFDLGKNHLYRQIPVSHGKPFEVQVHRGERYLLYITDGYHALPMERGDPQSPKFLHVTAAEPTIALGELRIAHP